MTSFCRVRAAAARVASEGAAKKKVESRRLIWSAYVDLVDHHGRRRAPWPTIDTKA
jgi:hypothetical protein